ncbi:MAG: VWA domain-containing protein [Oscillospiraceae bacterium]|nr:VWA domain-containing protein [Oscillospiraceae bacterium]
MSKKSSNKKKKNISKSQNAPNAAAQSKADSSPENVQQAAEQQAENVQQTGEDSSIQQINEKEFINMLNYEPEDSSLAAANANPAASEEFDIDELYDFETDYLENMNLTAEERLDRDLNRARLKVEHEKKLAEEKRIADQELAMEQIEKLRASRKRAAAIAERAAKLEREKQQKEKEAELKPVSTAKVRPISKMRDPMLGTKIFKGITVAFVLAGIAYAGCLIYAKSQNDEYIESMEKELIGIAATSTTEAEKTYKTDGKLSIEEKKASELTLFLPDTDKDGLSDYYEINVSGTDPKNHDTDGDNASDGAEIRSGLDPLSADDKDTIVDFTVTCGSAKVNISGKPQNAYATLDPVTNTSILGVPGIIGDVYEFYTSSAMQKCSISLPFDPDEVGDTQGLSVFKFNNDTLGFDKLESTVNSASKTVSADIDSIGIYTIGSTSHIQEKYTTGIFLLIDNSGSMYSEKECPGSEENDLQFKRVDFAEKLIDRIGKTASYGAASFTGTYTPLSPMTNDYRDVKEKVHSIRTADKVFNGTAIAESMNSACDELINGSSNRNYLVLLTDGYSTSSDPETEKAALQKAIDNDITVFTIGLGKKVDIEYLTNIAKATNGQYFQVSNAEALENICSKIESFMSYNKTKIALDTSLGAKAADMFIIADSGFNVEKDCLAYNNFLTDFSPDGTDYGIAELTREYYTGTLKLTTEDFKTDSGDIISGYDLRDIDLFIDGKPDLIDLKIDCLDIYTRYLRLNNKWNYRSSGDGLLRYSSDTQLFINGNNMEVILKPYTVKLPELERWFEFIQNITFQKLPVFSEYECAVISSARMKGQDRDIMDAFRYLQNLHESSSRCTSYDFGYNGKTAFRILEERLTKGDPVVISLNGAALNAARILRESENTNKYVLEAYDCNKLGQTTYIEILRTPVYDGNDTPYYQYSASVDNKDMSLRIYISED